MPTMSIIGSIAIQKCQADGRDNRGSLGEQCPFARFAAEDRVIAAASEGVSHGVRELFNLIVRREAIERRSATHNNSNPSDRELGVHG